MHKGRGPCGIFQLTWGKKKKTETEIVIIIPQTFAYCKLCDTERKKHFTAAAEC